MCWTNNWGRGQNASGRGTSCLKSTYGERAALREHSVGTSCFKRAPNEWALAASRELSVGINSLKRALKGHNLLLKSTLCEDCNQRPASSPSLQTNWQGRLQKKEDR
eukprot:332316-Pelagomonas_calceolata.AAC.2